LSRNLQPGIHPDADQLSLFVEGAATAGEQERMLAHLAECGECRKAVFLVRPHEEPQSAAITPEKLWAWRRWTRRWLVPVGVPVAALACVLIAVLIYIRPRGTPETPQQIASVSPPESERPGTEVAPTSNLEQSRPTAKVDRAPSANSELVEPFVKPRNVIAPSQESRSAANLHLPAVKSVPSQTASAAPVAGSPIGSVQTANSTLEQSTVGTSTTSNLSLNGRNIAELQQITPAGTQGAATQDILAKKKEVPALQTQSPSSEAQTLAGISGRITDRSGASIAEAMVTVRDAVGKTRQTTTGADGSFHLTQLPAGKYQLTATATGFKTANESIELKPSEMAMLQPVLDVGSVSETVEVEASAISIQADSASVSDQVVAKTRNARRGIAALSDRPILASVSQGKRILSLDDGGNLFLSRDEGKKWKKIKPRWAGKVVRIELTSGPVGGNVQEQKDETSGAMGEGAVFLLTTDGGRVWSSKDGAHWHQQ
jgi:hypothetical protein